MAAPADGPALAQTRVAVAASILQFANPLPFVVFDSGGRALIDFDPANHGDPTVYVSPRDLDELRTLLRRDLRAIVRAEQISTHDTAWATHRALLYATSLAFQSVHPPLPVPPLFDVSRDSLAFPARGRNTCSRRVSGQSGPSHACKTTNPPAARCAIRNIGLCTHDHLANSPVNISMNPKTTNTTNAK